MKFFLCFVMGVIINSAHSATLFTDRSNWGINVDGIVTESFELEVGDANMIAFPSGITATGLNPIGNTNNGVSNGIWQLRVYNPGGSNGYSNIKVTFPVPVMAFGLDINSISSSRGVKISGDWDGNGVQIVDLFNHHGSSSNGFFGVIGNQPFSEFNIFASDGSVIGDDFINADDLSYEDLDLIFLDSFE